MCNLSFRASMLVLLLSASSYGAVTLDRTRIIFPENEKSINIKITNDNPQEAYLAQSWIEDLQGKKQVHGAILATPPLQRIEANSQSLVRLSMTPLFSQLPQDRESVFYFNLREIPPKSDEANTLQIALQSRVKLFYRPNAILDESQTKWAHKVTLEKTETGYQLNNSTPFNLTVIGFGNTQKQAEQDAFEVVMVPPKSRHHLATPRAAQRINTLHLTYINDYGGKPTLVFQCQSNHCLVSNEL